MYVYETKEDETTLICCSIQNDEARMETSQQRMSADMSENEMMKREHTHHHIKDEVEKQSGLIIQHERREQMQMRKQMQQTEQHH